MKHPHAEMTYFALDGNYGSAREIRIIDTSSWSEYDWDRIEDASDMDRPALAHQIRDEKLTLTTPNTGDTP